MHTAHPVVLLSHAKRNFATTAGLGFKAKHFINGISKMRFAGGLKAGVAIRISLVKMESSR